MVAATARGRSDGSAGGGGEAGSSHPDSTSLRPGCLTARMIPPHAWSRAQRYLEVADATLSASVAGCYLVGSAALGDYRPGRSDVDLVLVVDAAPGEIGAGVLRRLSVQANAPSGFVNLVRGRWALPGTVNAVLVPASQLDRPVTSIDPLGSHVGGSVAVGSAFDVNPVVWTVLAERGLPVRGPAPSRLGLDPESDRLVEWNLANLRGYWAPWARGLGGTGRRPNRWSPARWVTAWGVLGAPRLAATVETGEIVTKHAAGRWALDRYGDRWAAIIGDALAYWDGQRGDPAFAERSRRRTETAAFVTHVVEQTGR